MHVVLRHNVECTPWVLRVKLSTPLVISRTWDLNHAAHLTCATRDPSKISPFESSMCQTAPNLTQNVVFLTVLAEGLSKRPPFPTNLWLLAVRLKNRTRVLRE